MVNVVSVGFLLRRATISQSTRSFHHLYSKIISTLLLFANKFSNAAWYIYKTLLLSFVQRCRKTHYLNFRTNSKFRRFFLIENSQSILSILDRNRSKNFRSTFLKTSYCPEKEENQISLLLFTVQSLEREKTPDSIG